jgi:uncharacterized protein (DUF433 family)
MPRPYDRRMSPRFASPNVVMLDRPVYGYADVDRLLGLSSGTARRWIEGYKRRKEYLPIVREAPTGEELVTWGEFVETSLLAGYREAGLRIVRLRSIVQGLRRELGVPYPLAHLRPLVDGPTLTLVNRLEDREELDPDLRMVVRVQDGQLLLAAPVRQFKVNAIYDEISTTKTDNADSVVVGFSPLGPERAVTIDPRRKFGQPVVRAVPTAVLYEQYSAGDSVELIADAYDLTRNEVLDAIEFERRHEAIPEAVAA